MIFVVFQKEMKSFFRNPIGYVIIGMFCLVVGWMFLHQLDFFINHVQKMSMHLRSHYDFTNEVIIKLFSNVNFLLLFITPILGMRFFSEEFKEGTIELYYSSPISDFELVIGKFLAIWVQGFFLIGATFIYPLVLSNLEITDLSFVFTGYLGLLLNFSCFAIISLFCSSLSKSMILSALMGFMGTLGLWIVGWFGQSSNNYLVSKMLNYFSINFHFTHLLKGTLHLSDMTFYLCFVLFGILLTKKRLEIRNWE